MSEATEESSFFVRSTPSENRYTHPCDVHDIAEQALSVYCHLLPTRFLHVSVATPAKPTATCRLAVWQGTLPSLPFTMPDLPQELIDKIIDEIAQQGTIIRTLRACSLVQKRWVGRSRRHLFSSISLYRLDDFQNWIKIIPPSPNSLHHHVRNLSYRQGPAMLGPKQLLDIYPNHFTSFTKLETLQIFNLSLRLFTPTSMRKAFGPVGGSVRTLLVKDVVLTLNSLLAFLIHFPRLQALELGDNLNILPGNKKLAPYLPNLTGELTLISMGSVHVPFVLELSKLPLRYSELDVEFRWNSEILNAMAHLILTCSPTLEKLTLRYSRTLFVDGTLENLILTKAPPDGLGHSQMLKKRFPSILNHAPSSAKLRSTSQITTRRSISFASSEPSGPANSKRSSSSDWRISLSRRPGP